VPLSIPPPYPPNGSIARYGESISSCLCSLMRKGRCKFGCPEFSWVLTVGANDELLRLRLRSISICDAFDLAEFCFSHACFAPILTDTFPLLPPFPLASIEEECREHEFSTQAGHEVWQGHPWLQSLGQVSSQEQGQVGSHRLELPSPPQVRG